MSTWALLFGFPEKRPFYISQLLNPFPPPPSHFFLLGRETDGFEHLQTGDGETLGATVNATVLLALVAPLGSGSGVEEDADEEEVYEAAAALGGVDFVGPGGEELGDAVAAADAEMLVAAVARDGGEWSIVVSLFYCVNVFLLCLLVLYVWMT